MFACGLESTCEKGICVKGTEGFKYIECDSDKECFTEGINGTCSGINKRTQKMYCEFPSANCRKAYKTLLECIDYNNCAPIITNNYYSCTKDKCTQELSKV